MKFRVWGIEWEDETRFDKLVWKTTLNRPPFYFRGNKVVGISEKSIRHAQSAGVSEFIFNIEGQEHTVYVPKKSKTLKDKIKEGMYEDRASKFEGSRPMRIYYFKIKNL